MKKNDQSTKINKDRNLVRVENQVVAHPVKSNTPTLSDDDLYFNYTHLPIDVKNKMGQNKSSGSSISKGIHKYYTISWKERLNLGKTEQAFKRMSGYIKTEPVSANKVNIVVEPFVRSESIKDLCKTIGDFTMESEIYFTD